MSEKIATRDSYGEALANLGEEIDNLVVLDADLSGATKTGVFAKKFPQKFFNMGIAEQSLMSTAAGLAVSREYCIRKYICSVCFSEERMTKLEMQ